MREPIPEIHVLVAYYSRFGSVRALADAIAEGVRRVEGAVPNLFEVAEWPTGEPMPDETVQDMEQRRAIAVNQFANSDAVIVGSPAYLGGMAAPIKRLFEDVVTASGPTGTDRSRPWRHHHFRDKVGAAFASSATPHGGNEMTLQAILVAMMHLGMLIATPGQQETPLEGAASPYGAAAAPGIGPDATPSATELALARDLGQRVAEVTRWVVQGRIAWARERDMREQSRWATASPPEAEEPDTRR